jgi:hypothetical protein
MIIKPNVMKKLTLGKYSNGKEEFNVTKIENGFAHLYSDTGVPFLRAGKRKHIEIGESSLMSFLERELDDFDLVGNNED